ncbi:GTP 3',8-cyclase MoaA [Candidatus Sumerlaeota bacterium]|nr:GTP 3',8-cyclase MoaA [Candidatus Sumerlaeota bacterium]
MSPPLVDPFQRRITYLRISVTDRCNLRCQYCMPEEGVPLRPRSKILTYEELLRLGRVFTSLGFVKFRITGGEPLVRHELVPFLAEFAQIPGVGELVMSTNAVLLSEHAEGLARAGVQRLNISLDTLSHETFVRLQRRDELDRTLAGIEAAQGQPFRRIKLNAVIIRGVNDREIPALARFALERGLEIRFIEFMPTSKQRSWRGDRVVPAEEMREALCAEWSDLKMVREPGGESGPSRVWAYGAGAGRVGFISAVSETFCQACNRVRLTSDGNLRGCLFADGQRSLRDAMREGASDEDLAAIIRSVVWNKVESHRIGREDFSPIDLGMSELGG